MRCAGVHSISTGNIPTPKERIGSIGWSLVFQTFFLSLILNNSPSRAGDESNANPSSLPPAEEVRLNASVFREALKKRGLTDILELYLREFPPGGHTEAVVALREVKLAEFLDSRRTRAERYAAIAEGNDLLEEAIRANPADPRRFEWYFTFAHSLVYHEAEPYFTPIMYHGGTQAQRRKLATLTTRALTALHALGDELTREFARLEQLTPAEYERLERTGFIESVDRLPARVEYLRLWTLYYNCLSRENHDATRVSRLNEIRSYFTAQPALLNTAHDMSRVQLQALLLAGMTFRLLNDLPVARDHLDRALRLAERLDEAERQRVQWAITLAHVERVRADRDDRRFDEASAALARFRASIPVANSDSFGRLLAAALVERSVWEAASRQVVEAKQNTEAAKLHARSWRALSDLAASHPEKRDELYAALYAAIEPDADPDSLDPIDTAALLAGLLADASQPRAPTAATPPDAEILLRRAVTVGESFLSRAGADERSLAPEIMYNVAVAEYRLGRHAAAAERFLRLARDYGDSTLAESSLIYAVELSALGFRQADTRSEPDRSRYLDSLELLIARHPESTAGKYWRFFYARLLAEQGAHVAAAKQFALVAADHAFALEAKLNRLQSLAQHLGAMPNARAEDQAAARKSAAEILDGYQTYAGEMGRQIEAETEAEHKMKWRELLTRAKMVAAEVQVHPASGKPDDALALLRDIESDLVDHPVLLAAVWRIRLIAYQQTGKLTEAAQALPRYVQADPQGAPLTLQRLFEALMEEARTAADADHSEVAVTKAEVAVLLAEQLRTLDRSQASAAAMPEARLLDLQLAEALLLTRSYARARDLVHGHVDPAAASAAPKTALEARVRFAYAEALFGLLDHAGALPEFNVLATRLPPGNPLRWRALLRDLQCRTALEQAPADILKVIVQQRHLFPDLGGPNLAREFDRLEQENSRRTR